MQVGLGGPCGGIVSIHRIASPIGVESNCLDYESRVGDGFNAVVEFLDIFASDGSGHLLDFLHH